MAEYIIVHTQNGYVQKPAGLNSVFTQDIADAHVFTKFEAAKTHADMILGWVWEKRDDGRWMPYYVPANTINHDAIDKMLGKGGETNA